VGRISEAVALTIAGNMSVVSSAYEPSAIAILARLTGGLGIEKYVCGTHAGCSGAAHRNSRSADVIRSAEGMQNCGRIKDKQFRADTSVRKCHHVLVIRAYFSDVGDEHA
jgi:hypothetical protein